MGLPSEWCRKGRNRTGAPKVLVWAARVQTICASVCKHAQNVCKRFASTTAQAVHGTLCPRGAGHYLEHTICCQLWIGRGKRFVFFASPALLAYFVQVKGAWRAKRFQGRRQQRHGGSNTGGDGWNEGQKQKHNTGGRHVVLVISIGRHSEAHIVPPHLHTVVCAAMSQIHSTHTVFCR